VSSCANVESLLVVASDYEDVLLQLVAIPVLVIVVDLQLHLDLHLAPPLPCVAQQCGLSLIQFDELLIELNVGIAQI
jgi:hypothetical protein